MLRLALASSVVCIVLELSAQTGFAQQDVSGSVLQPVTLSLRTNTHAALSGLSNVDREPSTGTAQIIIGWAASAIGVLNLVTIPLCYTSLIHTDLRDVCVGGSIGVGVVGLGIGIPLLIIGYNKRSANHDWKVRHGLAYHLSRLQLAAQSSGGVFVYRGVF